MFRYSLFERDAKITFVIAKKLGRLGEKLAIEYLQKKGYEVLDKNFTVQGGEIDIVAQEKGTIVFVEVKTRTGDSFGYGDEGLTSQQKHRIYRAIEKYFDKKGINGDPDYRLDMIEIDIDENSKAPPVVNHFEDIEL